MTSNMRYEWVMLNVNVELKLLGQFLQTFVPVFADIVRTYCMNELKKFLRKFLGMLATISVYKIQSLKAVVFYVAKIIHTLWIYMAISCPKSLGYGPMLPHRCFNSSLTLLSCHMSLAQLVRLRRLGWAGHVIRHDELIVHEVVFSQVDLKRRGLHRTLVADLADDLSHICSFAGRDSGCLATRQQGRVQSQLLIIRRTSWWSWLLQVSQLCQAVHLCHLVPEAPQRMPSAHWGDHWPELNWTEHISSSSTKI